MTDRTDRIQKDEFVRRIAKRMNTNQETAAIWVDAILDTLYEAFKKGTSVTLPGFGGLLRKSQVSYENISCHALSFTFGL